MKATGYGVQKRPHDALTRVMGQPVDSVELTTNGGMRAQIITLGASMCGLFLRDSSHNLLMTYDDLEDYRRNPIYLGASIGLNAGRLRDGKLEIDGISYCLETNEPTAHLHGGPLGLHSRIWHVAEMSNPIKKQDCAVTLSYHHSHLSDGYPGDIDIRVRYALEDTEDGGVLSIDYTAVSDRPAHLNMTQHNYYALSETPIDRHVLTLYAHRYCPLDAAGIPLSPQEIPKTSPLYFGEPRAIEQSYVSAQGGIDHPFELLRAEGRASDAEDMLTPAAVCVDPESGLGMAVSTNQPWMVVYTNNVAYKRHRAICFETQQRPGSENILRPGEVYVHRTRYHFFRVPVNTL